MGRYVDLDVAIERTLQDPVGATLAESNNLIGFLECLPIADVMPVVHAHWIDTLYGWACSNCEEEQEYTLYLGHCPHCGAKMDEVVE